MKKGSGFWFYTTYQQCPRKFYISHVLRLQPKYRAAPLLFGSAIHAACASFHASHSCDACLEVFSERMNISSKLYQQPENYTEDANRGTLLLTEYCRKWATDPERYDLIQQEEEMQISLPGGEDEESGFLFLVKPDRIAYDKQRGFVTIFEVKTTGWSITNVVENVYYSDQATAYLYVWNKLHPDRLAECVVPDVLYNRGKVYDCQRGRDVYRRKTDFVQYERGLVGLITEVTQKTNAVLNEGYPPDQVFPRRGDCDGDGAYKCEFRSICRTNLEGPPPFGFEVKEERK